MLFTQLLQRYSCSVTRKSSIIAVTCQLWRGKTRCSMLVCAVLHACQAAWHAVLCCAGSSHAVLLDVLLPALMLTALLLRILASLAL